MTTIAQTKNALANFIIAGQCSRVKIRGVSPAFGFAIWDLGLGVYVAGVVCGLLLIDGRPLERLFLAALWPIGPLAFVATVTVLLIVLPFAFPKVGIPLWLMAGIVWWLYSGSASM